MEAAPADGALDWFQRARRAFAADSAGAGEASLRLALERDSCFAPALALLSSREFAAGRHAEAIERLGIVSREPGRFTPAQRATLLAGLALHQDALGDNASARATLLAAPGDDIPAAVRVSVLLRGDTPDEATAPALDALKRDRRSAVNLNNAGIVQLRAGDADTACRTFLSAIERDADLAGPYYNLAILEKFYRFDDAAGLKWYQAYRLRSAADPDGLAEVFREALGRPVADGGGAR
jgi:Tfp pilus assembly protein PilF